jgi:acyl-coenzyme A thioesterase 13
VSPMSVPEGFVPFESDIPFLELIGPVYIRKGEDPANLGLEPQQRHANHRGTVMGGMLATLVDVALGLAIAADADDEEDRATASLTVDYLKPALPGEWIESRTSVNRVGKTLAFADCWLMVGEQEIVRARSVWASVG